jgi:hypothetical protein
MPPHCLPGLAACAPDEIEIINASAAAIETKRPVLMIASQRVRSKQPEITFTTSAPR